MPPPPPLESAEVASMDVLSRQNIIAGNDLTIPTSPLKQRVVWVGVSGIYMGRVSRYAARSALVASSSPVWFIPELLMSDTWYGAYKGARRTQVSCHSDV